MATLSNKTALVTGASRGIGRATAEALASWGARHRSLRPRSSGGGRTCRRNSRGRRICGSSAGGPLDAGRGRRARKAGSRDRRPAAGYLRVQCRHLEGRRDRGTDDRRLRQPVRHECPQSVLSREGVAAALPRGIEHHRRLLPGCSYCTRQSRATGRAITPCLLSHERSAGNAGQALGCACSGRAASASTPSLRE